jgi:hypothetical protein
MNIPKTIRVESNGCRVATTALLACFLAILTNLLSSCVDSSEPLALTVDCAAGDSVMDALAEGNETSAPLTVTIIGICREKVRIERDDVTIVGANPGDGIDATGLTGSDPMVIVNGARRVNLNQLTLTPQGNGGIVVSAGASIQGNRLKIDGAESGLVLHPNTSASIYDSNIVNCSETGILSNGAHLALHKSSIHDNGRVGVSTSSGVLEMRETTVRANASWGVSIASNAHAVITASTISENQVGVFMTLEASASIGGGTLVADNTGSGIRVWDGSTLILGATVEDNGSHGVLVFGNSMVTPRNAVIRGNSANGIYLRDTCLAGSSSGNEPEITGNGGWGVYCQNPPGDAHLQSPGYPASAVTGNTAGQISCPGYQIP